MSLVSTLVFFVKNCIPECSKDDASIRIRWVREFSPPSLLVDARFGSSIAQISDLNSDGYPEIAIGASFNPFFSSRTNTAPGEVHIISLNNSKAQMCSYYRDHGVDLSVISACGNAQKQLEPFDLTSLAVPFPTFSIQFSQVIDSSTVAGLANNDAFVEAVAQVGDLDGSGVPKIVVGAPNHDNFVGTIFLGSLIPASVSITPTSSVTPSHTPTHTPQAATPSRIGGETQSQTQTLIEFSPSVSASSTISFSLLMSVSASQSTSISPSSSAGLCPDCVIKRRSNSMGVFAVFILLGCELSLFLSYNFLTASQVSRAAAVAKHVSPLFSFIHSRALNPH